MNAMGTGNGTPTYGNSGYSILGLPIIVDANIPAAVAEKDDLVCFLGIDAYKLMLVNLTF